MKLNKEEINILNTLIDNEIETLQQVKIRAKDRIVWESKQRRIEVIKIKLNRQLYQDLEYK